MRGLEVEGQFSCTYCTRGTGLSLHNVTMEPCLQEHVCEYRWWVGERPVGVNLAYVFWLSTKALTVTVKFK